MYKRQVEACTALNNITAEQELYPKIWQLPLTPVKPNGMVFVYSPFAPMEVVVSTNVPDAEMAGSCTNGIFAPDPRLATPLATPFSVLGTASSTPCSILFMFVLDIGVTSSCQVVFKYSIR